MREYTDSEYVARAFDLAADDFRTDEPEICNLYKFASRLIIAQYPGNVDITPTQVVELFEEDLKSDFFPALDVAEEINEFMNGI